MALALTDLNLRNPSQRECFHNALVNLKSAAPKLGLKLDPAVVARLSMVSEGVAPITGKGR